MRKLLLFTAGACLTLAVGCSQNEEPITPVAGSVDGSLYRLDNEPAGALGVIKIRQDAKDQDSVVVVGRIGGSESPWVDGRAAFTIVDSSLKSCLECGSMECPKPWDYC
ncbi:MAG: hypothetical protein QGG36_29280 [Pirellulaceae bacterium]|jgi:hypothetical protein|nr:hypothetical protein [Pirellulaceae bacterium]MDP7019927.1 hypothetical protein [Pirellulaceae bacterium]